MKELYDRLSGHASAIPSKWRENAEARQKNKEWLRYSQRIAIMMLDKMGELGITQQSVAERMGCSRQYVAICCTTYSFATSTKFYNFALTRLTPCVFQERKRGGRIK